MRISHLIYPFFALVLFLSVFVSCRKDDRIDTDPALRLAFSTDTVFFDTVFPTVGSVTRKLLVYNENERKVKVTSIRLAGGNSSAYRININGTPATELGNVEIPGGDSIFVFVKVTVDPANTSTPFVVTDSIEFLTNGNLQRVRLVSWGRDAVFYRDGLLSGTQVWDSLKARVIYGDLRVDTGATLRISEGTRVYFHMNSSLVVSSGATLRIDGTYDHPVRMKGDRLDPFYKELPGQWSGIMLERGSTGHVFNHALIQNGTYGIVVDSSMTPGETMLSMTGCLIGNMTRYGIFARATSISAVNCLLSDCGRYCLAIENGGSYDFRHLTAGNFWNASVRTTPALYLSNYTYDESGNKVENPLVKARFANTIIYGANSEEIGLDSVPGTAFNWSFDHAILKTERPTPNGYGYTECRRNTDPRFIDINEPDYRIDSASPAIGAGLNLGITTDLRGKPRVDPPSLGAYEYVKGDR